MNRDRIFTDLFAFEAKVLKDGNEVVYDDRTGKAAHGVGILTVGYGRNLQGRGLTEEEARFLFKNDVEEAVIYAKRLLSVAAWEAMGDVRREVLVQMVFQMGFHGVRLFRRMLAALERNDYSTAAAEMVDSAWYRDPRTNERAHTLKSWMLAGTR